MNRIANKVLRLLLISLVIVAGLISGLLSLELFTRLVLRFPPSGIERSFHIYPGDTYKGTTAFEHIYKPHSAFFNNEAGYKIYGRNNYGLPGKDIAPGSLKNVFVMGNSFIEARSTAPDRLATSILDDRLQDEYPDQYRVINLGTGGQPPLYGLYRLKFWEGVFPADRVILVLENSMLRETKAWQDSIFAPDERFGTPVTQPPSPLLYHLSRYSAMVNLIQSGDYYRKAKLEREKQAKLPSTKETATDTLRSYLRLWAVVREYHRVYGDRLMVYSLMSSWYSRLIEIDCKLEGIPVASDSKFRFSDKYHLGEGHYGHFNDLGNRKLGLQLYDFFLLSGQ